MADRARSEPDTETMADMTRELARTSPPEQEGTGTGPWEPGGDGETMSQNVGVTSGQPLDAQMAQQVHQPAQGTEGGHAGGATTEPHTRPTARDSVPENPAPPVTSPDEVDS